MRSYRMETYTGPSGLVPSAGEIPEPGPGQVLVQVRASSLNHRDSVIANGAVPAMEPGRIPLSDGAGVVAAVGPGVERFAVGDNVVNTYFPDWFGGRMERVGKQYGLELDGWLTDYAVVREDGLLAMPAHLSFEEAATLPCAAITAWSALEGVGPGDTVLVLGTGGVSVFALQFAKAAGAEVIATTSTERKADRLRELGADGVVLYTRTPRWGSAVRDLTHGQGVDRIVETVGAVSVAESLRAARRGGQIALVGNLAPDGPGLDLMAQFSNQVTVRPVALGSRAAMADMLRVIDRHQLRPVLDRVFPFDQAPAAFTHFEKGSRFGKVVISNTGRTGNAVAASHTRRFDVPGDALWAVVGDFYSVTDWIPGIAEAVYDRETGSRRLILPGGAGETVETLVAQGPRFQRYALSSPGPSPLRHYEATLRVTDAGVGASELTWSSVFDAPGLSAEDARASTEGTYRDVMLALEKRLTRSAVK